MAHALPDPLRKQWFAVSAILNRRPCDHATVRDMHMSGWQQPLLQSDHEGARENVHFQPTRRAQVGYLGKSEAHKEQVE